jgi:RHS repeat-associated protein
VKLCAFTVNPAPSSLSEVVPWRRNKLTSLCFNKVHAIRENNESIHLIYGTDDERRVMQHYIKSGNEWAISKTKYYTVNYEEEEYNSNTRKIHYISGAYGLVAVYITSTNPQENNMYYVCKDHLGSITHLLDSNGNVAEEMSFDSWGRRRNPNSWTDYSVSSTHIIDRGFTQHEHYDQFGIINMNGRVYDPVIARFLNPDPIIQNPFFSQNFNRYSYVLNNPLRFIDLTGFGYGDPEWECGHSDGCWLRLSTVVIAVHADHGDIIGSSRDGNGNYYMEGAPSRIASMEDDFGPTGPIEGSYGGASGGGYGINGYNWGGTNKRPSNYNYSENSGKKTDPIDKCQVVNNKHLHYVNDFHGVPVYERDLGDNGHPHYNPLLNRIVVDNGAFSNQLHMEDVYHEFGHYLYRQRWGLGASIVNCFQSVIALGSLGGYEYTFSAPETVANALSLSSLHYPIKYIKTHPIYTKYW